MTDPAPSNDNPAGNAALAADLDLLAGLAAERLLDLQRAGAGATHRVMAAAAQAAHARLAGLLALRDRMPNQQTKG